MDKPRLFSPPTIILGTQEFQTTSKLTYRYSFFRGNPSQNPHRISEIYELPASAPIACIRYYTYRRSTESPMPWAGQPQHACNVPTKYQ